jgi:hypothetical protein
MKNVKIYSLIVFLMTNLTSIAFAAPSISNISGTVDQDSQITVNGTLFGAKTAAVPKLYDDFEDGIDSNLWSNPYALSTSTANTRGGADGRNLFLNVTTWGMCLDQKTTMEPAYGGKFYASYWVRLGGNWNWNDTVWSNGFKIMRFYGGASDSEFCWSQVGNGLYLSNNSGQVQYNITQYSWTPKTHMQVGQWYHFEFEIQVPSSSSSTDGKARFYVNGTNQSAINLDPSDNLDWIVSSVGNWRFFRFGWHYNFGGPPTAGTEIYFDDGYADNSWARVVIGNNANYSSCTKTELQIPSSWNSNQVTCSVKRGSFAVGQTAYLFVIDPNGVPSPGYPITIGSGGDSAAPTISLHSPAPGATGVAKDTNISFHVTDAPSGVNSATIQLRVNNTLVTPTITGTAADYTVTYNPPTDFNLGQVVDIKINASDLNSTPNVMPQVNYTFTVAGDSAAPSVTSMSPASGGTGIAKDTNISFHVTDALSGVNSATIQLRVNNTLVTPTITGTAADYTVTYNPPTDFNYGQVVDIKINASDLNSTPNVMTQINYTFTIASAPVGTQFSTGSAGDAANYTKLTSSRWETVNESGNVIYRINTTDFSNDGDRLGEYAFYNQQTYLNFELQLRARVDDDIVANAYADYAIIFGYQDYNNYYYVMFNRSTASNQLFRVSGGTRTELAKYSGSTISGNTFDTVRVTYSGSTIEVYYNGALLMTATGQTLPTGNIGFGSYNDAASFDDVVITALSSFDPEDVDRSGAIDNTDVGYVVSETIGIDTAHTERTDVDASGSTNVVDVQKVVNAVE